MNLSEVNKAIAETRAEMRASGVKRSSCFNGGHSPLSYRLNARMFELETMKQKLKGITSDSVFRAAVNSGLR